MSDKEELVKKWKEDLAEIWDDYHIERIIENRLRRISAAEKIGVVIKPRGINKDLGISYGEASE